jgi:hypothetical protein
VLNKKRLKSAYKSAIMNKSDVFNKASGIDLNTVVDHILLDVSFQQSLFLGVKREDRFVHH